MGIIDPIKNDQEPALDAQEDALAASVVSGFKAILNGFAPQVQERILADLFKSSPPNSAPRPREMLATILRLVPRDTPVTIEDVKKSVQSEGIPATAKMIANALGYFDS